MKSKEYIADLLIQVIETIGPKNVVQVITDNAANYKAAGLIVEAKYSNIFWTPCVVHTLNLALKNICAPKNNENQNMELQFISDAAGDALQIKNYIMNHGMRLSMFNEFSKLKFLAIADTRFASVIVMLKRFLLLKDSLVRMWWGTYGARTPELKELAFKLLGQPASSSCCERNWSTYGFIHSLRRNKLTPERAENLVYVHNNLRLLSRCTDDYLTGLSKMWDVGVDEHETFDGISVLQGAELTLDEPEFEVMMIEDEAASAE
ncbi:hypothetical protein PR202_gb19077 [Eleusine coracana subsp. coracana]|uniref:DUF659 domain-containing protein n=1 Tax=Eleusine coracana subsp. coracana TaxID=191504 RepID=A0AAV5F7T4_ELECO|nr:hypothetical protein PR202_gb19077 [Eleusine coracana subsp. coracana]